MNCGSIMAENVPLRYCRIFMLSTVRIMIVVMFPVCDGSLLCL